MVSEVNLVHFENFPNFDLYMAKMVSAAGICGQQRLNLNQWESKMIKFIVGVYQRFSYNSIFDIKNLTKRPFFIFLRGNVRIGILSPTQRWNS